MITEITSGKLYDLLTDYGIENQLLYNDLKINKLYFKQKDIGFYYSVYHKKIMFFYIYKNSDVKITYNKSKDLINLINLLNRKIKINKLLFDDR